MALRTSMLGRDITLSAGVSVLIFTVPAGQTWLVKDICTYNFSGVPARIQLTALSPAPVKRMHLVDQTDATNVTGHWQGFFVMEPGDFLQLLADQANVSVWVSGAKLIGTV